MQGILYEESSVWLFLLVTCVMGGWAAWMTGRAIALAWKSLPFALLCAFGLALVVRFIHYALFKGTLLSLQYYLVDLTVLLVVTAISWRVRRVRQMTTQYRWLYEPAGPFAWRERAQT